ncbi:MAG: two-component system sensor histidine kinase [Candidatus Saccharibacteria bacterium]|nr:two-component system sensor histidine kinase [Candidatus Saccharibacteria bacterium]
MRTLGLASALFLGLACIASLEHARRSKAELAKERDLLEKRVAERTQELEETQLARLLELQRFAEFGRLSAHLLHDVTNPLTAASLNLQQLGRHESPAIAQARKSLRQLERYVQAARKQLRSQSYEVEFNVQLEMKQLLAVLKPLASKAGVSLVVEQKSPIKLYGDPVRFNQIMANLVANAIDAYSGTGIPPQKRRVVITIIDAGRYLHITVCDYGKGITAQQLPQIFEPFYTTKHGAIRGLGIGLSIVKQYVRDDFKGTICVNSSQAYGTTFTLLLRR